MEPSQEAVAGHWVHAFEDDTEGRLVYRPAGTELPRSRRPREQLHLLPEGRAETAHGGPDDRMVRAEGHWTLDGRRLTVYTGGTAVLRAEVVDASAERLVLAAEAGTT